MSSFLETCKNHWNNPCHCRGKNVSTRVMEVAEEKEIEYWDGVTRRRSCNGGQWVGKSWIKVLSPPWAPRTLRELVGKCNVPIDKILIIFHCVKCINLSRFISATKMYHLYICGTYKLGFMVGRNKKSNLFQEQVCTFPSHMEQHSFFKMIWNKKHFFSCTMKKVTFSLPIQNNSRIVSH